MVYVPCGNKAAARVYEPPLKTDDASGAPVEAFSNITTPVGVPPLPVTVPVMVPDAEPATPAIEAGPSVVTVVVPTALGTAQFASNAVTLVDPSPVARLYALPLVALNAGASALEGPVCNTPFPPVVVLLQFGLAPTQGTALLPFVMFMNTQKLS